MLLGDGKPEAASKAIASRYIHWKVWLVAADCMLLGLQPVLMYQSKQHASSYSYHPLSVNVLVEIAKICFATSLLLIQGHLGPRRAKQRSWRMLMWQARRNSRLFLPAVLYSINSYLKFVMLLYFRPTTAKMLGNLKVLVIAVLMRLILRRRFTLLQWEALLLLCIGVTINHLNYCSGDETVIPLAAISCTAATLVVPSLASIFNEWALKRDSETPIHLQNLFLYFFGLALNLAGLLLAGLGSGRSLTSLFSGHSKFTAALIIVTALQGLLSSIFYKYADTVLKKYSSTLATMATALLSAAFLKHALTLNFLLAVLTIACSMHIFYTHGKGQGIRKGLSENGKIRPSAEADIEKPAVFKGIDV